MNAGVGVARLDPVAPGRFGLIQGRVSLFHQSLGRDCALRVRHAETRRRSDRFVMHDNAGFLDFLPARSARQTALEAVSSGTMMANSSPPQRLGRSESRHCPAMAWATSWSSLSPTWWP